MRQNDSGAVRLFVAIDVGPRDATSEAPRHLTLRFLGEVDPSRVPDLVEPLERVARETPPFDLVLEGVGAFPNARNPRVVWIGATEGREEARALARRVDATLDGPSAPLPREEFVPHVTLFRVRSPAQRRRAEALLDGSERPPPPQRIRVTELHLKESTLAPAGAVHRNVGSWRLAAPSADAATQPP